MYNVAKVQHNIRPRCCSTATALLQFKLPVHDYAVGHGICNCLSYSLYTYVVTNKITKTASQLILIYTCISVAFVQYEKSVKHF